MNNLNDQPHIVKTNTLEYILNTDKSPFTPPSTQDNVSNLPLPKSNNFQPRLKKIIHKNLPLRSPKGVEVTQNHYDTHTNVIVKKNNVMMVSPPKVNNLNIQKLNIDSKVKPSREFIPVLNEELISKKLYKEFFKVQLAVRTSENTFFNNNQVIFKNTNFNANVHINNSFPINGTIQPLTSQKEEVLKNSVSVNESMLLPNTNMIGEGELVFSENFFTQERPPYKILCEGFGEKGMQVAKFITEKFPLAVQQLLEKSNAWTKGVIWNALKEACFMLDKKIPLNFDGGSRMIFSVVLMKHLWVISVGSGGVFIINEKKIIPMARYPDLSDKDFYHGIHQRGGEIYDVSLYGDNALSEEILNSLNTKDLVNNSLTINKVMGYARAFGHTIPSLCLENQKVFTAQGKITCVPIKEISVNHLVVHCSKTIAEVASFEQIGKFLINRLPQVNENLGYQLLAEEVVKEIVSLEGRKKEPMAIQVFKVSILKKK